MNSLSLSERYSLPRDMADSLPRDIADAVSGPQSEELRCSEYLGDGAAGWDREIPGSCTVLSAMAASQEPTPGFHSICLFHLKSHLLFAPATRAERLSHDAIAPFYFISDLNLFMASLCPCALGLVLPSH